MPTARPAFIVACVSYAFLLLLLGGTLFLAARWREQAEREQLVAQLTSEFLEITAQPVFAIDTDGGCAIAVELSDFSESPPSDLWIEFTDSSDFSQCGPGITGRPPMLPWPRRLWRRALRHTGLADMAAAVELW